MTCADVALCRHDTGLIPAEAFSAPTLDSCRSVTEQQMSSLAHGDYCSRKCKMYFNSSLNKLCLERRAAAYITGGDYTLCGLRRVQLSVLCTQRAVQGSGRPKSHREEHKRLIHMENLYVISYSFWVKWLLET